MAIRNGREVSGLSPEAKKTVIVLGLVAAGIAPVALGVAAVFKSIGFLTGGLATGARMLGKYRISTTLTSASISTMGNYALVASTKMNTANVALAKSTKGMGALRGGAMTMFGGKWGAVTGIATMFLPEILKGGKAILGFGKTALSSVGGIVTLTKGLGAARQEP